MIAFKHGMLNIIASCDIVVKLAVKDRVTTG